MTTCQKCGGEVQGWLCQGCGQAFRETDGKLVFDHAARTTFDGLVLVQREPTEAMVDAGYQAMFNHDNVVDIYAAMLAAAPPVDGWQPIETAPKDGTGFLVNCPHVEDGVSMMTWDAKMSMLVSLFDGKPWVSGLDRPTKWQPLPQPPNNERTPG